MFQIREETAADAHSIREVNRLAFERDAEAVLVERLGASGCVVVSLVALQHGRLVGHILFSELRVKTARGAVRAAALAPMSVLPAMQGRGIGSELVRAGLDLCRRRGVSLVVVLGDPAYYRRFGFSSALAENLRGPFRGEACMALELVPGALEGATPTVTYPEAFAAID